jgi:2,3-bisphosphoglycerate-dependent phosphoglycerate mutase/probable phosphoglycerate mutase
VRRDDRLGEIHYAAWQGLSAEQIDARWPGFRAAGQRPDGAERDEDVLARALACLDDIASGALGNTSGNRRAETVNGPVLVVTHGGLMRVVCAHLGAPIDHLPNLGGRWLSRTAAGWQVTGTVGALTSAPWTP